jgi:hypothetical protein
MDIVMILILAVFPVSAMAVLGWFFIDYFKYKHRFARPGTTKTNRE